MESGQRHGVIRYSRVEWLLGVLVLAAAALVVSDLLRRSPDSLPGSGGLLIGTVTALIARRQFALSVAPMLRYTSGYRTESRLGLTGGTRRLWCVDVSNNGRGAAIVTAVSYDVLLRDPPVEMFGVSFVAMLDAVQSTGFRDEHDFVLDNWSVGTSVRDGEDRRLWEIPDPVRDRIQQLVLHLEYRSILGETLRHDIKAIPDRK